MSQDGAEVLVFGEVLADRFPDGSEVLGGAPFNVAWNLRGFGATPYLVSRIGKDELGSRIRSAMADWGMETGGLQVDSSHPTGVVEVSFEGGEPDFEIVPGSAWDFIAVEELRAPEVSLLYHGSLACRSAPSRAALAALQERRPQSIFFDVNLRSPWWERERIRRLLGSATEIKLNEDELTTLAPAGSEVSGRAVGLLTEVGAERLHLTRGERGALTFPAGGQPLAVAAGSVREVVDPVGAGDAFSSVLILGSLREWPLAATLARASEFAAAVVGLRGATSNDRGFYRRFADKWGDS